MKTITPLFLIWKGAEDEQYYEQFTSLESAVYEGGDGVEVFQAVPVSLGKFKRTVQVVRVKKQKTPKK